ncbi:DUF1990 family protein [Salinibacterium sp. ZJ450]|uniref:DUF1990 family protein n=1 Tax=Salinibacterium sp. ZJ450 TaxID=2708338 RepID=UPI001CD64C2E|nr:DUF1990 domain-containing protein [Salinibacterium sp. ZJ450]
MRRASHQPSNVTYGAIGGTQADDLLTYPPTGFRAAHYRTRIGHGDARFEAAVEQLRTWQLHKYSGIEVQVDEVPPVDETSYTPVGFDQAGKPVVPAAPVETAEIEYTADGAQLATPGTTATLTLKALGIRWQAPVRVVFFVEEPHRRGLAYGTRDGHPLTGEESFVIDQTDDGSVWLDIRLFWRPSTWYWWAAYPGLVVLQRMYVKRYLKALVVAADAAPPTDATPTDLTSSVD